MSKTIITFLFTIICLYTYGQEKITIDQPCVGLPSHNIKTMKVLSQNQLPTKIQFIINTIFKNSMTDFTDNIKFSMGQIIDLDELLINDSTSQTKYKYVTPKYELFYELSDTNLGIQKYCFELSLTEYGQVTCFEWPWKDYNKKLNFIDPILVKAEAINYAKSKNYKTDTCIYELKYDSEINKLCWHISFLQKSIGDEYNYSKEYKTIVIDAIFLTVLKELEMGSRGYSD